MIIYLFIKKLKVYSRKDKLVALTNKKLKLSNVNNNISKESQLFGNKSEPFLTEIEIDNSGQHYLGNLNNRSVSDNQNPRNNQHIINNSK